MPSTSPDLQVVPTRLPGVCVIEPRVVEDRRGFFVETWTQNRYQAIGLPDRFVQDNLSRSVHGTLRGLHLQHPHGQGKLIQVFAGEIFDVAVDVRTGSPTRGHWVGLTLSGANHRQVFVPPGFAHGFCVLSEWALFAYKCTEYYHPETEFCVAWDDPDLAIEWPIAAPVLSPRDAAAPRLRDIPAARLPPA